MRSAIVRIDEGQVEVELIDLVKFRPEALGWHFDPHTSYRRLIPQSRHLVSKGGTLRIERHNLNFKTRIERLQRRTICSPGLRNCMMR
jgi:IS1 family transposase